MTGKKYLLIGTKIFTSLPLANVAVILAATIILPCNTALAGDSADSQREGISIVKESAKTADGELNTVWTKLKQNISKGDYRDLVDSQKYWITVRNKTCNILSTGKPDSNWIDALPDNPTQIKCIEKETRNRKDILQALSSSYKRHKYTPGVCDSFSASLKYGYDRLWINLRKAYSVKKGKNDEIYELDGDPSGLLVKWEYGGKYDPSISSVSVRNKGEYSIIHESDEWFYPDTIRFDRHTYIVASSGFPRNGYIKNLDIYEVGKKDLVSLCSFRSIDSRKSMPKIPCPKGMLCKILPTQPGIQIRETRYVIEPDLAITAPIDESNFSHIDGDMSMSKQNNYYLVDLDNDKVKELIVVFSDGPPNLPFPVKVYKKAGEKYSLSKQNYGIPSSVWFNGDAFFISKHNGMTYVINRKYNSVIQKTSLYNYGFRYEVYLSQNGKTDLVDKRTINVPAIIRAR